MEVRIAPGAWIETGLKKHEHMHMQDMETLKLHIATDGTVWFADGTRAPVGSGMDVPTFVQSLRHRSPLFVRVMGWGNNAALIAAVYHHCQWGGGTLEVASPLICRTVSERLDPQIALYRMRQVMLPPSLGGWHRVTGRDYPSYALAATLIRDRQVTDHALVILRKHPVWRYLQFIPGISEEWAATVLGLIVDPRWFIDTDHPDRGGRLRAYMGLLPRVQEKASAGQTQSQLAGRCQAVLYAWQADKHGPTPVAIEEPGYFLWRIHRAAGGGVHGDLKASQAFLTFLRHTWLETLYVDTTCRGPEALFVPDMLFNSASEVQAFQHYMNYDTGSV